LDKKPSKFRRTTPSELACPNVQIENRNGWLELIQRGYNE